MASDATQPGTAVPAAASGAPAPGGNIEHGAYEIIRNRLSAAGRELRARLKKLNAARKDVFGAIETKLLATERVTTSNNCVPRDITAVGDRFVFGYNVMIGLKSVTTVDDVFSIYRFHDTSFAPQPLGLIDDPQFRRDFEELFKYYRNTRFAKFANIGPHLFMVFRTGPDVRDIKTFKWRREDERIVYLDNRSDHELRYPPQHDFTWTRTHRDMHRTGRFPHINIEDRLFVETIGGDLTIKVEDNTESGEGIYSEPVDNPDQTLDDAEIFYAVVGNLVLLKIRPYQEEDFRHFVYSGKTRKVHRIDSIEQACVLLPEDHGLIFSNGYFLQTGEYKTFEHGVSELLFRDRIAAPNGEDFLYVFFNRIEGVYVLLPYNLIEQQVKLPVICNGYSLFEDGRMILFKGSPEPQKHHTLQIWQTPYVGHDYQPPTKSDSFLFKIGNRDIVRGMAECHEVLGLIAKEDSYVGLFVDLTKTVGDLLDSYHWLGSPEAFDLRSVLEQIKEAAQAAIGEYEKVESVRRATDAETRKVSARAKEILASVRARRFEVIGDFVTSLTDLRTVRGEIIALKSLRYADTARIDALDNEIAENAQRVSSQCVLFLLRPESLQPYQAAVDEQRAAIPGLRTVAEAKDLQDRVARSTGELEMLIDVVSNLKIDDATQRTAIIDGISGVLSQWNQVRAALRTRRDELMRTEGAAEFASQVKLLQQGVLSYLDVCDTPERCEEYLTKMMVQVEELEGRFAEFDEFLVQLTEKREEIYNAFETRRVQLVEARSRRATALAAAAERILKGVKVRIDGLKSVGEIHGYFAGDLMIEKIRDIVRQLGELGDTVKVDDIESRLKTIREDAVRQLKDRQDLYEDGENVIRLGNRRFNVNRQTFDLTTVFRDGEPYFHLTGTGYFDRIDDAELLATRNVWSQEVISENGEVYRAEYLAQRMLESLGSGEVPEAAQLLKLSDAELLETVQRFMGPRFAEGYVKGVHDHDAAKLLRALLDIDSKAGLLRHHPRARALARLFWRQLADEAQRAAIAAHIRGFGRVREVFPDADPQAFYLAELHRLIAEFVAESKTFPDYLVEPAAAYLFEELSSGDSFVVSAAARDLYRAFHEHLKQRFAAEAFSKSLADVKQHTSRAFALARDWLGAFAESLGSAAAADYVDETALMLLDGGFDLARVVEVETTRTIAGMQGNHAVIEKGTYALNYHAFRLKLRRFDQETVPKFQAFARRKQELLAVERKQMRLDEFRPRVLTSFVRNRLINDVYLPLMGDNFAKQVGVAGDEKRTDRMGMLLLISPPGYGKTTLMEYVANRLGLVFMKINGPALGHQVTSLDPGQAPNAAAREEINKLSLSFEMGDNVMIYVDDIQHCHPEFLQKFISLCDAQRKIEGVWRGQTRTYDFRGKRVCVVMAGNPYTESGEKFKIPDMLANRADIYNLGEIIGGNADAFHLSYLENALTSNPVLGKLAARSQADVYALIRMAEGATEGVELEGSYAAAEVGEMVTVMQKLMRVRDIVLKVNAEYIRSAGTSDEYRTEPPFKLQGSYRNMNRVASRVVAIMNDRELDTLILDNYQNDAQTLTTGAESNLLKFKQLCDWLTREEAERWEQICRTYTRNVQMRGIGDDEKFGQLVVQLTGFSDGLHAIQKAVGRGVEAMLEEERRQKSQAAQPVVASFDGDTAAVLKSLLESLRANNGEEHVVRAELEPATLDALRGLLADLQKVWANSAASITATADEAATQTAGAPDAPAVPSAPPVQIVNRVPATILNVLRHQFRLMQGWLEPLERRSSQQAEQIEQLKQILKQTAGQYQTLIGLLEEAAQRKEAVIDVIARDQAESKRSAGKKRGPKQEP
ncbi:MAG: DNA repair ATPase [Planctomycetota bacterium]